MCLDIPSGLKTRRQFGYTLEDQRLEPENDGLVQMIFLYNWVIFRFHVNLPGCSLDVLFLAIFYGFFHGEIAMKPLICKNMFTFLFQAS